MDKETLRDYLVLWAKAIGTLDEVLQMEKTSVTRDSAIKRFEYNYEIAWKTIKRFAEFEGYSVESPRNAFKTAATLNWLSDKETWLDMIEDRNETMHTYQEVTAEQVYLNLHKYCEAMKKLHSLLSSRM